MHRLRNAALVTALLVTGPTLAGTPIASSGGTDTPSIDLASVPVMGEITPAPSPASAAAPAARGAAVAEPEPGTPFETLVADFRWGAPEMGAEPFLPVPPPYRMRAEDAGTESSARSDDPARAADAAAVSPDTATPEPAPTASN